MTKSLLEFKQAGQELYNSLRAYDQVDSWTHLEGTDSDGRPTKYWLDEFSFHEMTEGRIDQRHRPLGSFVAELSTAIALFNGVEVDTDFEEQTAVLSEATYLAWHSEELKDTWLIDSTGSALARQDVIESELRLINKYGELRSATMQPIEEVIR